MENNLYYTPTLNEFYIGFECEILGIIGAKEDERLFSKPTIITQKELAIIHLLEIRVKFLDQKDIESLGWTFKSTNKMRTWYTGSDNWFNNTIPTGDSGRYWSFELSHDLKYNGIIIKAGTNYGETDTFFEGTIKNKSELIKLQQQLNIINYDNK